jgi:hypothetical protein
MSSSKLKRKEEEDEGEEEKEGKGVLDQWLMLVILATQEAEIRRISV